MKFWQKIFIVTLVLFLLFLNGSIFVVFQAAYDKTVAIEKERAISEHHIIANSFARDVCALKERKELEEGTLSDLFKSYERYYENQNIYLELWKGGEKIYGYYKVPYESIEPSVSMGKNEFILREIDGEKCIYMAGLLAEPVQEYTFVYLHPLGETLNLWDEVKILFVNVSVISSITLAILLFCIVLRLSIPLVRLTKAANKIGKGDYGERVEVKGKDEIAILAGEFNSMAGKIEQKIEEVTEESNRKQRFIDNLAHELRTPLTTIYGYAEFMQKAKINEETMVRYLNYIMQECKHLQNMTKELLNLSIMKNEEIARSRIDMGKIKEQLIATLELKIKEKNINFFTDCEQMDIYGNEMMLQILLNNLLENAIRACSENGNITMKIKRVDYNAVIIIEDDGVGMESEELKHIFDAFYRVDKARSRKEGGAGLGLTLCKQIVELHQGTIRYDSEKGRGTTVTVVLNNSVFTTP